jgi:hypothetical protein
MERMDFSTTTPRAAPGQKSFRFVYKALVLLISTLLVFLGAPAPASAETSLLDDLVYFYSDFVHWAFVLMFVALLALAGVIWFFIWLNKRDTEEWEKMDELLDEPIETSNAPPDPKVK